MREESTRCSGALSRWGDAESRRWFSDARCGEEPDVTYTILFINGEQLVVPGLHGTPLRVLRVPFQDAIALRKNLFAGMKAGTVSEWIKIAKWYADWRKRDDVTP